MLLIQIFPTGHILVPLFSQKHKIGKYNKSDEDSIVLLFSIVHNTIETIEGIIYIFSLIDVYYLVLSTCEVS